MTTNTAIENALATVPEFDHIVPGHERRWPRRTVLKTIGTGAAGGLLATAATGSAAAKEVSGGKSKPQAQFGIGEVGTLGDGHVVPFSLPDHRGRPGVLGVLLTADVFEGLPDEMVQLHLDLPQASETNFTFALLDWNPHGHPPEQIYGFPHFDFHFYLIEEETVTQIPPGVAEYTIPDEQFPPDYVTADALGAPREVVPGMGEHLVSPKAREFQGDEFTHTLIWGAYNPDGGDVGELIFVEPMITKEYLEGQPTDYHAPISTPEAFVEAGYYPTEYAIRYLSGLDVYLVTLEAFEWFPADE